MFQFEEKEEMAGDQAINPMAQRDVENNERPKSEKENNNTQELQQTRGSRADKPKAFLTKKLEKEFERKKKDKEAREKRLEDIKKEDEMRKKKEKDVNLEINFTLISLVCSESAKCI